MGDGEHGMQSCTTVVMKYYGGSFEGCRLTRLAAIGHVVIAFPWKVHGIAQVGPLAMDAFLSSLELMVQAGYYCIRYQMPL